jgi:hypothetical protein
MLPMVVLKVVHSILWLSLVEPENFDPFGVVVLFGFAPNELPGSWICGIEMNSITLERHGHPDTPFRADKEASFHHLVEVFGFLVYRRPDRDHELYAHVLQLFHHGIYKTPLASLHQSQIRIWVRNLPGSGQYVLSNFQSPCAGQWKKSATIRSIGSFRRLYSLATSRSSSWVW